MLLPFFLSSCKTTNVRNVTTDFLKGEGSVWVGADCLNGLTNVSVLTFTSSDKCNWLFAGSTVDKNIYQGTYKIENNKVIISVGEATYECIVKKDELLMYAKSPNTVLALGKSPSKMKRMP